jgi:hypothetical protein
MSKERVGSLMDEVAKLRRTVHEMQQTSAAREVTIVQLRKERERDREDVNGLNIALDSKQQELELVSLPWKLWFRISCDIRSRGRFR